MKTQKQLRYQPYWKAKKESRYIRGRYIATLKKNESNPGGGINVKSFGYGVNEGDGVKTALDYEILRSYAVEGSEAPRGVESELAVLMIQGTAAWLVPNRRNHIQRQAKRDISVQDNGLMRLTVLLANMVESKKVT